MGAVVAGLMKAIRKINESLLEQAAESRALLYKGYKTKDTDLPEQSSNTKSYSL